MHETSRVLRYKCLIVVHDRSLLAVYKYIALLESVVKVYGGFRVNIAFSSRSAASSQTTVHFNGQGIFVQLERHH